jgi:hypothetical protein
MNRGADSGDLFYQYRQLEWSPIKLELPTVAGLTVFTGAKLNERPEKETTWRERNCSSRAILDKLISTSS